MIVSLGQRLRMTVLAEGVETAEQLARLQALGCDLAQGFLFSPAVAAPEVARTREQVLG
jgi:EAL domain-containing protein (putative c-di-GMP-specific phosphodiesterase class I)